MSLSDTEYAVLRQTIAARGTARMVLFPVTMIGWAALALVVLTFAEAPGRVAVSAGGARRRIRGDPRAARRRRADRPLPAGLLREHETGPAMGDDRDGRRARAAGRRHRPALLIVFVCATFVNIIPALALQPRADLDGDRRHRCAASRRRDQDCSRPRRGRAAARRGAGNVPRHPFPNPKSQAPKPKPQFVTGPAPRLGLGISTLGFGILNTDPSVV